MIELIKHSYDDADIYTGSVKLKNDATLDQVLNAFEVFLVMCGYSFDGHLEIIEEDFVKDSPNGTEPF